MRHRHLIAFALRLPNVCDMGTVGSLARPLRIWVEMLTEVWQNNNVGTQFHIGDPGKMAAWDRRRQAMRFRCDADRDEPCRIDQAADGAGIVYSRKAVRSSSVQRRDRAANGRARPDRVVRQRPRRTSRWSQGTFISARRPLHRNPAEPYRPNAEKVCVPAKLGRRDGGLCAEADHSAVMFGSPLASGKANSSCCFRASGCRG